MKKNALVVVVLSAILFMSSCTVLSFYPLYTQDKLVLNDKIIGKWQTKDGADFIGAEEVVWEISFPEKIRKKDKNKPLDMGKPIPNKHTYRLLVYPKTSPADSAEFYLHLVKLGDKLYLDFFPQNWNSKNSLLAVHLMFAHTFAKIEVGQTIQLQWLNSDWLHDLFEKNKIRMHHEDNGVYKLITAKPEELRKFLMKYDDDAQAFEDGLEYELIKAE